MKTHQTFAAALLTVVASLAAMAQEAGPPPEAPLSVSTLTRAEVLADLQIYRESGLANLDSSAPTFIDWNSREYARASARYTQLRASPYFATLVQRIAARRAEKADVVQR